MVKLLRFLLLVAVLVGFLLLPDTSFAHRILVQYLVDQENIVQVLYDDGTPASRATVSLIDESGAIIWTSTADSTGKVQLPGYAFAKGVADDGLGHRIMFTPGEQNQGIPRWLAATVGVAFLLFVAALSKFFSKRKLVGG